METDWTDFFYLARAAKHADCRGRRAASSPLTEKTNLASERGREQTVPTCPLHSTPVSIITARDDDGDCTEIQSDLPTGRPSDDAGAPSLPSRLVGVRAYTLSLCRQSGADSKGQVKTNSPRLRLLSRLSWFVSGLVRLRPSDCATLPFLRC